VGLQDMDERRIKCIQNFMRKSAQTEQEVSHRLVGNSEKLGGKSDRKYIAKGKGLTKQVER